MPHENTRRAPAFVSAIGSHYAVACSLLITCLGTAYAMKNHLPWLAFALLLPLTFSAFCAAWTWYREASEAQQRLAGEHTQHEATRRKAEQAATEVMGNIRTLLRRYGLGSATDIIQRSIHLLSRMKSLEGRWKRPPAVRQITEASGLLYATTTVPIPAIAHIRDGDTFLLVQAGAGGVRHKAAMLQVNQKPDPENGVVHFIVTYIFNADTDNLLRSLARTASQPPRDLTIDLPFNTQPFDAKDLAAADTLLSTMAREFNDAYLAEVDNG